MMVTLRVHPIPSHIIKPLHHSALVWIFPSINDKIMKVTDRNEGIWHFNVIMLAYETKKFIILEIRKSTE